MKTIWKSPLSLVPAQTLDMPAGAKILTVQDQAGQLTVWFECDPNRPPVSRAILLVGTGKALPDTHTIRYISTVQQGEFVWHFYEAVS